MGELMAKKDEMLISGLKLGGFGYTLKYTKNLSRKSLLKGGMRLRKNDCIFGTHYLLELKYEEFLEDKQSRVIQELCLYVTEEMYKELVSFINKMT